MDRHLPMEAFVRVVDTGSFSGAARQCRLGSRLYPRRSPNSRRPPESHGGRSAAGGGPRIWAVEGARLRVTPAQARSREQTHS
jgi:hypothetical protein